MESEGLCEQQSQRTASVSFIVWLLVGYMWLFIHRPFEIWPWLATIRIERTYMILTIVCWLLSGPKFPTGNRLHGRFGFFVFVMLASWVMSPYSNAGDDAVANYLKYAVFYVLLVTSIRNKRDLHTILTGYVAVMTLLMAHSLREYFSGRAIYAQGIVRLWPVGASLDFNDLAGLIVCSLPFVWVLWHETASFRTRLLLLGYLCMAGYCVMLTGSRMGFCGVVLASMLACLASRKRWQLLAMYPVLAVILWTAMPQDRKDRILTLVDPSRGPRNAIASAGNFRYSGFKKALPLFDERPLLGFGPMGYHAIHGIMPHNLYGQVLAELGVLGAIAFASILLGVGQNTLEAKRIRRNSGALLKIASPCWRGRSQSGTLAWHTVLGMSATFLLLAIMSWGFNFLYWHVWLWFGAIQTVALACLRQHVVDAQLSQPTDTATFPQIILTNYT